MIIVSKVGVASVFDHMYPFSVQILGTTLHTHACGKGSLYKLAVVSG